MFSCTVTKNIDQIKDQSLTPFQGTLAAPFRTVLRGIDEEISPKLVQGLDPTSILLLGLSFNLRSFHPDMLFCLAVPHCRDDVLKMAPGTAFVEREILDAPASGDDAKFDDVLSLDNWLPGGKACLIRTIEFIDAVGRKRKIRLPEVIENLARGGKDWLLA